MPKHKIIGIFMCLTFFLSTMLNVCTQQYIERKTTHRNVIKCKLVQQLKKITANNLLQKWFSSLNDWNCFVQQTRELPLNGSSTFSHLFVHLIVDWNTNSILLFINRLPSTSRHSIQAVSVTDIFPCDSLSIDRALCVFVWEILIDFLWWKNINWIPLTVILTTLQMMQTTNVRH